MIVRTLADIANAVDRVMRGVREVQELARGEQTRVQELVDAYREAQERYIDSRTLADALDRLDVVIGLTESLHNRIQFSAEIVALEASLAEDWAPFETAIRDAAQIADLGFEAEELPPEIADRLGAFTGRDLSTDRSVKLLSRLAPPLNRAVRRQTLAALCSSRLRAMHALLLTRLVGASPDNPGFVGDVSGLRAEAENRARALRDGARAALSLASATVAPPAVSLALVVNLQRWERWFQTEAIQSVAGALAVARRRLLDKEADAFTWARDAGRAYDALRLGLAWNAGARAILLALAFRDSNGIEAARSASKLGVGAGDLDLPRTPIEDLPGIADGTVVETEGIVTGASFVSGGPAPRSVLTLTAGGASILVLVPFTSVDSFGIVQDVWVQVRGKLLLAGKDNLPGPVVQVRRILGKQAAERSFSDFLVAIGRPLFELRPGQLDLVAGRRTGDTTALNEIKVRPGDGATNDE